MSEQFDSPVVQKFLAKYGDRPVKWRSMIENMDSLSDTIAAKVFKPLHDRIAALEVAAKEAKSATFADAYKGLWAPGVGFRRGDLCTSDGSLWLCQLDTTAKPGSDAAWRMITKRGRDGKDLR